MTECAPCRGRGWITQEDSTGMPGRDITCPYCKGRGTAWWVAGKRESKLRRFTQRRLVILGLAVALAGTGNMWPPLNDYTAFSSYMFVLHLALWLALLVAWIKSPPRRKMDPDYHGWTRLRNRHRHGPGFGAPRPYVARYDSKGNPVIRHTPGEGKFLAGFGAVVGLRSLWDSSHKRGF